MALPTGFVVHRGVRIYQIDVEGLEVAEVVKLADRVAREIRAEPPRSVRTLTHVRGAVVNTAMVDRLRWLADGNKPHVKASAIAGLGAGQRVVLNVVKTLTGRDFELFATREEALDFLAGVP
jgi:hypothetical protein